MSTLLEQGRVTCGELRSEHLGAEVVLMGWVGAWRDLGGRRFIDLRDRYGLTQVTFGEELDAELSARGKALRSEWVIAVRGVVEDRVANGGSVGAQLETGAVEVRVTELEVLSESETPPFLIADEVDTCVRSSGSSIATSTFGGSHCKSTWSLAIALIRPFGPTSTATGFWSLRPPSLCARPLRERVTTWSRVASTRGPSLRSRRAHRSLSSSSWSEGTISTFRSRAAFATRTSGRTVSRSSLRSTWRSASRPKTGS